jgi:hypothetical protein
MVPGVTSFMPGATLRACRVAAGMTEGQLADCMDGRSRIRGLRRYWGNGARQQIERDILDLERTNRYPEPRYLIDFLTGADECLHCASLAFLLARLALAEYGGPDEAVLNKEDRDTNEEDRDT